MKFVCNTGFLFLLSAVSLACAMELVSPVELPHQEIVLGATASLNDDIYSGDADLSGEFSFTPRLSVWGATSYRFISYQYEFILHDQLHEYVNLQVSGLNATYLGFKYFPLDVFGFGTYWRFRSRDGDSKEHFNQIGASLMGLYPFSLRLSLGASIDALSYFERMNYHPGRELGGRLSLVWKPAKWEISEVVLYRHRMNESLNFNMDEPYRKMDDEYSGIKIRASVSRRFGSASAPFYIGIAYEISKGTLFGFETGHLVKTFVRKAF